MNFLPFPFNRYLHWSSFINPDIRKRNVNNLVDPKNVRTSQHNFWSHHRRYRLLLHFHHWRNCSFGILNFSYDLWNLCLEYYQIDVFQRFFSKQCYACSRQSIQWRQQRLIYRHKLIKKTMLWQGLVNMYYANFLVQ